MTRPFLLLTVCSISLFIAAQDATVKVPLPCESTQQLVSPTGAYAAVQCKDQSWMVLEIPSGKSVHRISEKPGVSAYSFSADGKWFAAGSWDGTVQLVPLAKGSVPISWRPDESAPGVVQVLPTGHALIAPFGKAGQIWQVLPDRKLLTTIPTEFSGLTFAAANPNNKLLAVGGADTKIRIYDTQSWKLLNVYSDLLLEPFAGSFTPDGKYLLVGGADTKITVIDPFTATAIRTLPASPAVVADIFPLGGSERAITVQWDADGKQPPFVALWDLQKGMLQKLERTQPITGGGVVQGTPWLISVSAVTMNISKGLGN